VVDSLVGGVKGVSVKSDSTTLTGFGGELELSPVGLEGESGSLEEGDKTLRWLSLKAAPRRRSRLGDASPDTACPAPDGCLVKSWGILGSGEEGEVLIFA
jgi:hypothetical protein